MTVIAVQRARQGTDVQASDVGGVCDGRGRIERATDRKRITDERENGRKYWRQNSTDNASQIALSGRIHAGCRGL